MRHISWVIVEVVNEKTGKKKLVQIFPRYHQLEVVRNLLADVAANGAGIRYLFYLAIHRINDLNGIIMEEHLKPNKIRSLWWV